MGVAESRERQTQEIPPWSRSGTQTLSEHQLLGPELGCPMCNPPQALRPFPVFHPYLLSPLISQTY